MQELLSAHKCVRTTKIAGNEKHEYVTQNGKVVRELVTNATTNAFIRCMDFIYDESGRPFAMRNYWNSSLSGYDTYHYILNAQGDVVQITYQGGTVKATYTYDAWGQVLTATGDLAAINPLRYRGYYYDTETGFYYLQSRYYDPVTHRFINADSYASTGQGILGYNMFVYCNNIPTNYCDKSGNYSTYCTQMTDTGSTNWKKLFISRARTDYNAVQQKMFSDISKESAYPFWSGTVFYVKVEQVADYNVSSGDIIAQAVGVCTGSYVGGQTAKKVVPKAIAKLGLQVSMKALNWGITLGNCIYNLLKAYNSFNEMKPGNYNQFVVRVEGFFEDYVSGVEYVYNFEHTITIVENTAGKEKNYIILDETYYTWRD